MGKVIFANIGSIQNCKAALRNRERVNNESKTVLLYEFTSSLLYYRFACKKKIKGLSHEGSRRADPDSHAIHEFLDSDCTPYYNY
jgi:hypothetical protein